MKQSPPNPPLQPYTEGWASQQQNSSSLYALFLLELGRAFGGRRDKIFISKVASTILTINVLSSRIVLWEACSRAF